MTMPTPPDGRLDGPESKPASTYPDLYGEPLFRARLARDLAAERLDAAEAACDVEADAWLARLDAWMDAHPALDDEDRIGVAVQLGVDYDAWRAAQGPQPETVVLCGSTRFVDEFRRQALLLTLAGHIVLSIGCDTKSDADLAAAGLVEFTPEIKARLDELHLRKIDKADRVFVLDVGGYVGESTAREIAYAEAHGKPVRYLSREDAVPARYDAAETARAAAIDARFERAAASPTTSWPNVVAPGAKS